MFCFFSLCVIVKSRDDFTTVGDATTLSSLVPGLSHEVAQAVIGWSLGGAVPFYFYIGLAVSGDGGETFVKASPAPVLGRSKCDPFLTASPAIIVENGLWRMWYVSGTGWERRGAQMQPSYLIKYADSPDGVVWSPTGHVCIDFASPDEYAFGRPCVIRDGDIYKMWYCCRGDSYRIGYAESRDGLEWNRRDGEAGMGASTSGWDSQMQAYPFICDQGGRRYMFYNGNGYGRTGFGLAIAE